MTCREFADFMLDYLAGTLPEESRAPFDRHLSRCVNCQKYIEQYRRTLEAGRTAFADQGDRVPVDVPEDLIQAVLASRRG